MAGKFQFTMRSGPTTGAIYPLEKESIAIGRNASNTIQINDPEMSRRHARLQLQGGKYVIEDLGSTNGTHVNGQRLAAPYVLKPGDVVSFGEQIVLAFDAVNTDPGATVAVQRKEAPRPAGPSTPQPSQVYVGQIPASPTMPPPAKKRSPLPLVIVIGLVILLCACIILFWIVDAKSLWCTIFPFLDNFGFVCL